MKTLKNNRGNAAVISGMLILISGLAFTYMGFFIMGEMGEIVNDSINDSTALQDDYDSVNETMRSGMKILGIVFIILGAAVVLSGLKLF